MPRLKNENAPLAATSEARKQAPHHKKADAQANDTPTGRESQACSSDIEETRALKQALQGQAEKIAALQSLCQEVMLVVSSLTTAPARHSYKSEAIVDSFSELPFVYWPKRGYKNAKNWHVPPTDDYGHACEAGRGFAAHLAQYMKDNPHWAGSNTLGMIAKDIDFKDKSPNKGYWVGFFAHLEHLIYATAKRVDVFADLDKINAQYAKIEANRALEAETEQE